MEFKHFSHNHGLTNYQVIQGTEVNCSGCNSSATGAVYVCWPCNFFLHEYCFSASRSMKHPSHPLHPLTLVPYPTYPSNSFFCNSCSLVGTGLSYSCSNCEFDLHVHCAYMPISHVIHNPPQTFNHDHPNNFVPDQTSSIHNPQQANLSVVDIRDDHTLNHKQKNEAIPDCVLSPLSTNHPSDGELSVQSDQQIVVENTSANRVRTRGLKHFSHSHPLYLSEVEGDDPIVCSGCEEEIIGTSYSCSKSKCEYYLHKECFELPREIRQKSHIEHPLTLLASPSDKETGKFTCKACFGVGSAFTYHCSNCEYDLHVSCSLLLETVKCDHHEHALSLIYSSPNSEKLNEEQHGVSFVCDVCKNAVPESYWLYYCKDCEYGTHLSCVHKEKDEGKSLEDSVVDHQAELQRLQLQIDTARQNAQLIISMGQNLANL